ncbi:ABC transporter permease [Nocardia sp. NPDC057227]|uniref:ABC transporter permease n=1 Tax=Nocardia sp. NPDC057227 TaxID=3346056 RepID=UPI00363C04E2
MNPVLVAVRTGLRRGVIEIRQALTSGQDLFGLAIYPLSALITLFFMRDATFQSSGIGLGALALPSLIGLLIVFNSLFGIAGALATDREDGTLLRAKATPNGMVGYLTGKIVAAAALAVLSALPVLIGGLALIGDGLDFGTPDRWLALAAITALGLLATLPLGAALGSLFTSPRNLGYLSLPIMGLVAISGIFYPITALPGWLQAVAQAFPVYWMGLGTRAAMLPDSAAAVELGESWRHLETIAVLGFWAVVGLVLAPPFLRRMARRESGSSVAARREKALQRAY